MKAPERRLLNRAAVLAVVLYLAGAVGFRVASQLGLSLPWLAPLYHSLPGALAGGVSYAAWTGLRARRQSMGALALSAAVGGVVARLLEAPVTGYLASLRPGGTGLRAANELFGQAAWELVCDLSAVTILFALFMTASMPLSRRPPTVTPGSSPGT